MVEIVGVIAVMAAILFTAGWVFCSLLPAPWRDTLLPGLPLLGVVVLVVAFHWTGLILSTDQSLVVLAVLFAAATPVAIRRSLRWRPPLRKVLLCAVAPLAAVPAVYAGLIPAGGALRVVQVTPNNDAYAYVTLSDWFQSHSVLDTPRVPPDAPAYSYSRSHLDQQLRVGEEFLQAAGATVTGREPDRTWYVLAASWLLLYPSSIAAAASVLGLPPLAGAVAGGVAASSSVVLTQLFNQNSASLLGIAVAPLVVALLIARLRGVGEAVPPRWLVAIFAAALFGVYAEYLPVVVLVIALLVVSPPFDVGRRAKDALVVGGLTVVISPLAASKLIRSFLLEKGLSGGPYDAAAFLGVTPQRFAARLLGVIAPNSPDDRLSPRLIFFAGALLVGLIGLLVVRAPTRQLWAVVPSTAAVIYYLDKVRPFPYAHQRAVDIGWPIVLCAACLGLAELIRLACRRWGRLPTAAAALVVPLSAGAFITTNMETSTALSRGGWISERRVDGAFDEAIGWIRGVEENRGANVMVGVADFFGQLWTVFGMRQLDQAAFPFLYKDYVPNLRSSPALGLWDGALRRYLLVDEAVFLDAGPGVVIRRNRRFMLLDLTRGEATVGIPVSGFHHREITESGPRYRMSDSGRLLVIRTLGGRSTLVLRAAALPGLGSMPLEVRAEPAQLLSGAPPALATPQSLGRATVTTAGTDVRVVLPAAVAAEVVLLNGKPARPPADGSSRDPESLQVEAIRQL